MVKLVETTNVSLARECKLGGKDFIEVPAIGDGNCALNSFALGLIDLIKRNQTVLKGEEKQREFMAQIVASLEVLEDRLHLYSTGKGRGDVYGNAYPDLAHGLEEFIQFIKDGPDYYELVAYIDSVANTREQIAALHVALAPALRNIAVARYQQQMKAIGVDDQALLADAHRLQFDGVSVGHESLVPLAHDFFQINLNMFESRNGFSIDPVSEIADAPTINVLHVPGHWNYLIDAEQKDGLVKQLGEPEVNENDLSQILDETESLVLLEGAHAEQFVSSPQTIEPELGEVVQVVKQAGENLLVMAETGSDAKEYDRLSDDHSKHSSSILKSVRENVDLSDKNLESLKLSELEKDLLLGKLDEKAEAMTDDARLARALQDAEILHFVSAKHATFFGGRDAKRGAVSKEEAVDHTFRPKSD